MRCSACLTEMRHTRAGHVCPKCGETGTIRLDDGREATFQRSANGPGSSWAWIVAVMFMFAGFAGAGWWWRTELLSLVSNPAPSKQVAAPVAPDWRAQGRALFEPPLDAGLIALFGTEAEDRLIAFTALGNGELVTFVETLPVDRDPAYWIVRYDGSETLSVSPVEVSGALSSAALAPLGVDGFLLALGGSSGARLEGYGTTSTPRWRQELPLATPDAPPPVVLGSTDLAIVVSGPGGDGRAVVSAFDPFGLLVWQKAIDANGVTRFAGALREEGGLVIALVTPEAGAGQQVSLHWISEAGDTLRREAGRQIDAPLAGVVARGEGVQLLVSSSPPQLLALGANMAEPDRVLVPEAALHDTLLLVGSAAQGPSVVSAYQLADVQTDLVIREEGTADREPQRLRLPAGAALVDALAGGAGSYILAGSVGSGAATDVFLLAVSADAGSAGTSSPADPPALATAGAPTSLSSPPDMPSSEATSSAQHNDGDLLTCRFSCLDEESVFPLTKSVLRDELEAAGGLVLIHVAVCSRLGAEAALEEPDCAQ